MVSGRLQGVPHFPVDAGSKCGTPVAPHLHIRNKKGESPDSYREPTHLK
jgi:hypothetical protein